MKKFDIRPVIAIVFGVVTFPLVFTFSEPVFYAWTIAIAGLVLALISIKGYKAKTKGIKALNIVALVIASLASLVSVFYAIAFLFMQ